MKRPKLDFSVLQLSAREWLILFLVIIAFTSILTAGRAYNSNEIDFWLRIAMWSTICTLIVFQSVGLQRLISIQLQLKPYRSALSVVTSLFVTIVLVSIEVDLLKYTPLVPKAHDPFLAFALFMTPPVLVVGGTVLILIGFHGDYRQHFDNEEPLSDENLSRNLSDVWPQWEIYTVHAQEHYLLIKGEFGEELVRARMIDAEISLKNESGLRIHRSWWVATSQLYKVTRKGRDYELKTKDGQVIPVGRSRVNVLKKAGWIV